MPRRQEYSLDGIKNGEFLGFYQAFNWICFDDPDFKPDRDTLTSRDRACLNQQCNQGAVDMHNALRNGDLLAIKLVTIRGGGQVMIPIETKFWSTSDITSFTLTNIVALLGKQGELVMVRRDDVERIWPPVSGNAPAPRERASASEVAAETGKSPPGAPDTNDRPGSGVRTTAHADAERLCEVWLQGLPVVPRWTKPNALTEAKAQPFGQALSDKAFERAWARAANNLWKSRGRPKKGAKK